MVRFDLHRYAMNMNAEGFDSPLYTCSRLLPQGVTQHGARSGSYRNASDVAENDKLVSAQSSAEAPLAVILSGMSFDATYAIATLLAKNSLTIDRHELPRGQLLVMGGDEVYPLADKKIYRDQLVAPPGLFQTMIRMTEAVRLSARYRAIMTGTMAFSFSSLGSRATGQTILAPGAPARTEATSPSN
jgi:hypothetical protein